MTRTSTSARPGTTRFASPRRRGAGNIVIGIFIGLIAGLALAAGVAYWLMKNNPAIQVPSLTKDNREPARTAKGDTADKPRFDFYKILPGVEEPKVRPDAKAPPSGDRAVVEQSRERPADKSVTSPPEAPSKSAPEKMASAERPAGAKPGDKFWLQAGSFGAAADAENLKARLALDGWEAIVQEGQVPDKGTRYRVRLGPYDNTDELNRMRNELAKRGFDVAVIKY
ncbi:MAG TPA: SPOR domain-containing protein [Casimicrobiaceae bacterium]|nr:SPOR domain-containing protein [Casimicrobiaceae bacterium]